MARPTYDRPAVIMHWVVAVLILAMIGVGYTMVNVAPKTPAREFLFNLHKSVGVVVLVLTLARLAWRIHSPPPAWPADMSAGNKAAASAMHWGLYAAVLIQAFAGYLASEFGAYGVAMFGFELPRWGAHRPEVRAVFLAIHHAGAAALVGLTVLHAAAATIHAWRGGPVHERGMWPRHSDGNSFALGPANWVRPRRPRSP